MGNRADALSWLSSAYDYYRELRDDCTMGKPVNTVTLSALRTAIVMAREAIEG